MVTTAAAGDNQCEVVLVGCGCPKRGMGWYHAVQMIKGKCPSAKLCFVVEPWFMGAGTFLSLCLFTMLWCLEFANDAIIEFPLPEGLDIHYFIPLFFMMNISYGPRY